MNQIAHVQAGKTPERVIVLPSAEFDALKGREGYRQRANGRRFEPVCKIYAMMRGAFLNAFHTKALQAMIRRWEPTKTAEPLF